jgi:hypothetical protein
LAMWVVAKGRPIEHDVSISIDPLAAPWTCWPNARIVARAKPGPAVVPCPDEQAAPATAQRGWWALNASVMAYGPRPILLRVLVPSRNGPTPARTSPLLWARLARSIVTAAPATMPRSATSAGAQLRYSWIGHAVAPPVREGMASAGAVCNHGSGATSILPHTAYAYS